MDHYLGWVHRAASLGRPTSAHLELTYRCNARCRICYQDRDGCRAELGVEGWRAVVDDLRGLGVLVVTLSGGEPLLYPGFWEVASHVRGQGMAFKVFTNGSRLDRRACVRLAALRPLGVEVTVFSSQPGVHDGMTGVPGSWWRAVKALARLRRLGVPTRVKTPMVEEGVGRVEATARLAARLGARQALDPAVSARDSGDRGPLRHGAPEDTLVDAYRGGRVPGLPTGPAPPRPPGDALCGVGRRFLAVGPDGRVLACPRIPEPIGHVRDGGLRRAWEEAPLLARFREVTFGALRTCGTCPHSGYCGRCSAVAALEDGDLLGPSTRSCRLARVLDEAWGRRDACVPWVAGP